MCWRHCEMRWAYVELFMSCWIKFKQKSIGFNCQHGVAGIMGEGIFMKIYYVVTVWNWLGDCLVAGGTKRESVMLSIKLWAIETRKFTDDIS